MKKLQFFLILFIFCLKVVGQDLLMNLRVKTLQGDSIAMSSFGGKKIMFVVLPTEDTDSLYHQLSSFCSQHGDKVQVLGVFSIEDGYTTEQKEAMISTYGDLPILLLEAMYTRKGSSEQSPLMKWLTCKLLNRRFDQDVSGPGHKFFVNQVARLYASLPAEVSLLSPFVSQVVNSNPPPFPGSQHP